MGRGSLPGRSPKKIRSTRCRQAVLPGLSASAPAIISLRSFEIWLVVKADCSAQSDSEVSGLCFDFFLIFDVLLED